MFWKLISMYQLFKQDYETNKIIVFIIFILVTKMIDTKRFERSQLHDIVEQLSVMNWLFTVRFKVTHVMIYTMNAVRSTNNRDRNLIHRIVKHICIFVISHRNNSIDRVSTGGKTVLSSPFPCPYSQRTCTELMRWSIKCLT